MDFSQSEIPSVQDLLHSGVPFLPFSEFSVHSFQDQLYDEAPTWLEGKLQAGRPFVIRGFTKLSAWDQLLLNNESLVNLSFSGAIPVRNCHNGRDVRMRLRDLLLSQTDHNTSNVREFLYAKDLNCPEEWITTLEAILPSSLRHLGSLDLFRVLPKEIAPEVLMAYAGTRRSFSGFHRCLSGTVALNLMIASEGTGPGSICFGTDRFSQNKYDSYMEALEKSPHTDWANVSVTQLKSADFPIYVTHQEPGDLLVFPSATAHQIWNISPMVTKVVWNIMHHSSLTSFFDYVQPAYQRHCHAETGRAPLIPLHALKSDIATTEMGVILDIFRQLVDDENTGSPIPIKTVDTQGAVVECNFCGLTIWNRHLHCEQCGDFDLCLTCFISGRSCKHIADYTWAEMIPNEICKAMIEATRNKLGDLSFPNSSVKQRSLGALAVAAADARQQSTERLCHLCRDNHPVWKGITCSQCSAFFCFRGLHRHFDIDLIAFLRREDSWLCPKCSQMCNCRCCHFLQPYESKDKPVRARVKPVDPRGRVLGFVDNVFDQKRGKRASLVTQMPSTQTIISSHKQKRPRLQSDDHQKSPPYQNQFTSVADSGASRTRRSETADLYRPDNLYTDRRHINTSLPETLGPRRQLRISALVENRAQASEVEEPSHYRPTPSSLAPESPHQYPNESRHNDSTMPSPTSDESIPVLEKQLDALRQYASDLLELSLVDSHAKVLEKIAGLESQVEQMKRRKAELLFRNLNRDFPDLANIAIEEARRRGL